MIKRKLAVLFCLILPMGLFAQTKVVVPPFQGGDEQIAHDLTSKFRDEFIGKSGVFLLDSRGILSESYGEGSKQDWLQLGEEIAADYVIYGRITQQGSTSVLTLQVLEVSNGSTAGQRKTAFIDPSDMDDLLGYLTNDCISYMEMKVATVTEEKEVDTDPADDEKTEEETVLTDESMDEKEEEESVYSSLNDNSPIIKYYELDNDMEVPLTEARYAMDDMNTAKKFKVASWCVGVPGVIMLSGGALVLGAFGIYGLMAVNGQSNGYTELMGSVANNGITGLLCLQLSGISVAFGTILTVLSGVFNAIKDKKIENNLEEDYNISAAPIIMPNDDGTLTAGLTVQFQF